MKQYVVDQLRYPDYEKLKAYLDQAYGEAKMPGIYWIPLEEHLLTPIQAEHRECQPFAAAVELQETRLSLELLVRTRSRIRCHCIAYADDQQRHWLLGLVDRMLEQLDISV
jgi:hypothetical protein